VILPHIHVSVGLKERGAVGYTSHLLEATVQLLTEMIVVEVLAPDLRGGPYSRVFQAWNRWRHSPARPRQTGAGVRLVRLPQHRSGTERIDDADLMTGCRDQPVAGCARRIGFRQGREALRYAHPNRPAVASVRWWSPLPG
jgi:hypothetical protein